MGNDASRPVLGHWVDGKTYEGVGERRGDVYDPATGELTKHVAFAAPADVDAAVASAQAAFASWRATSLTKRVQILFAFREALSDRREELAEIVTSEHGKVRSDALGEVMRGLEVVEFACGIPQLLK
ncbi:MAG TPA: aldehyde dehydrogenase family protein, partial [Acidimicrobiales bacterium]|nr:aldehyde dehydrogenase family protein [Acidimicrobiales bacterium]